MVEGHRPAKSSLCTAFLVGEDLRDRLADHLFPQPRPQGLLFFQNGGRGNLWPRLLKYSKNRGVFCHVAIQYNTIQ